MIATDTSPVNQRARIITLRIVALAVIPLIIFSTPAWGVDSLALEFFENVGILLLIAGVIGRLWSILYAGGRKNKTIVQIGPYSISRHPLYMFSTLAVLGLGMMLGSVVLTILLTGTVFLILRSTAQREEKHLRAKFGPVYDEYAARVPQIIPSPFAYVSTQEVTVDVRAFHRTIVDAMSFLMLIPFAEFVEILREVQSIPHFVIW
ncbi:Protein-S-isoprenylcysteine O-methyltransferase Ste14 [Monaibacterium marinum]|uniref:Protein-S-isoprenylcysteine O-methyltransferase Ste14 n=1 Tax=Pontivivens marinum TaxID=1690039 RepID=A0A2C9CSV3_9RHOB|nr:isoprenylcysteine carboxylmethyltransferase family protein [Monaibacterium marinum]SOH94436.1 Protein-S-isoprenylcysteine O-methyltransferase Ste14 [Monaibacterium marinum]